MLEPLLAEIRSKKNVCVQLREKYLKFILTKQYENEPVHDYMTRFKMNLKLLKLAEGNRVLWSETVMKVNLSYLYDCAINENDRKLLFKISSEHYEAACFLMGSHY